MSSRDTAREADLLARINGMVVNGCPLREWPGWQQFQQPLLFADIPAFYARGESPRGDETKRPRVHTAVGAALALIVSGYAALKILLPRPRVFIFAIDKTSDPISGSDSRIRSIYDAVRKTHATYIECFHTSFDAVPAGLRARRRAALYLEAIDLLWRVRCWWKTERIELSFGALPQGTIEERRFMKAVVTQYLTSIPRHAFRSRILSALISCSRPRIAFLVDDTRHYFDAVAALRMHRVPTYAVQHGQFSARHVGWQRLRPEDCMLHPEAILVWNEYWKHELELHNPVFRSDAIIVGGNPTSLVPLRRKHSSPLTVLVPFESEGPYDTIRQVMKALQESGASILFKPRPDWPLDAQLARYGLSSDTPCVHALDAYPGEISVALGTYTTLLYELVARGLPVALLAVPGVPENPIADRGLADAIKPDDPHLSEELARIAAVSDAVMAERSGKLRAPMALTDSIAALIQTHALSHP